MISVIVPLFNENPTVLARSLESLAGQSLTDFECLIVDESIRADTVAACDAFVKREGRFVHIRPPQRLGLAASLNLGLDRSKCEFIARFDSDDLCEPERLARQLAFLQSHPGIGVVGSGLAIIDDDNAVVRSRRYPEKHAQIARRMQWTNGFAHPTVMFRRELIEQYGGYRAEYRYCEDLELWLRLLKHGVRFANLPEPLVKYRQTAFTRATANWQYNLKARISNFALDRYAPLRVAGIVLVAMFLVMPRSLQSWIYRLFVLSRPHRGPDPRAGSTPPA